MEEQENKNGILFYYPKKNYNKDIKKHYIKEKCFDNFRSEKPSKEENEIGLDDLNNSDYVFQLMKLLMMKRWTRFSEKKKNEHWDKLNRLTDIINSLSSSLYLASINNDELRLQLTKIISSEFTNDMRNEIKDLSSTSFDKFNEFMGL